MDPIEGTPFYKCSWDSTPYSTGLHTVSIKVTDENASNIYLDEFSLDGTLSEIHHDFLVGRDLGAMMMWFGVFMELAVATFVFIPKILMCFCQRNQSCLAESAPGLSSASLAWTESIQSGKGKVEDYLQDSSFSTFWRTMHVLTWGFQDSINMYGKMNMKWWIYFAIIYVYMAFLPAGFNFDDDDFLAIFLWGLVKKNFTCFELTTTSLQLVFPVFCFFTTFTLIALWTTDKSAIKIRRGITCVEFLYYLFNIIGTVGSLFMFKNAMVQTAGLFASPYFYIVIANNIILIFQLISPFVFTRAKLADAEEQTRGKNFYKMSPV